ncbi:DUF2505 domain-containing protein [Mycolicibacterium palauense]|uniref:DUF2505 domain-containing protein n=1 Tax=Mycolicibacterium palauense TaxID=2034511 RepID=UPI000BFEF0E6|nr:DUF2505 domain-containing protein [Mycolicibacterium palauense]
MSRRLDYTVDFAAPAEKIHQDFTSRQYWDTLMDAYGWLIPLSKVDRFTCDEDGTTIVVRQNLPRDYLPTVARSVMPVDMIITREQHFAPFDQTAGTATGGFRATVPGGPGYFRGHYLLADTPTGSRLRLSTTCKVRIPFVGGVLEQLILSHIPLLFDAEEAFTADWITKHH